VCSLRPPVRAAAAAGSFSVLPKESAIGSREVLLTVLRSRHAGGYASTLLPLWRV